MGLGLFGAEVASALALRIVAMELTNPFRELVALEALNAGMVKSGAIYVLYKAPQVLCVAGAIRFIPPAHHEKAAICFAVIHEAHAFR
ncbi:hypothetical protein RL74_25935 [Pseudomonas fluorescens]|uniref:Uncharacterized protein n=1 Tax=Pseudomonas fluorescens TaxID=294 RepID=A0A0D0P2H7_PSEFL|nr:hypothetical protein RL74_25935 [Pseudomonas fluorescens]